MRIGPDWKRMGFCDDKLAFAAAECPCELRASRLAPSCGLVSPGCELPRSWSRIRSSLRVSSHLRARFRVRSPSYHSTTRARRRSAARLRQSGRASKCLRLVQRYERSLVDRGRGPSHRRRRVLSDARQVSPPRDTFRRDGSALPTWARGFTVRTSSFWRWSVLFGSWCGLSWTVIQVLQFDAALCGCVVRSSNNDASFPAA